MMEGMEDLVGRKLKPEFVEKRKDLILSQHYVITRPDFYSDSMHINMRIHVNDDFVITGFSGDKCYSVYRGLYNRSASVHDREFTKRDIAYFRKYVKEISE